MPLNEKQLEAFRSVFYPYASRTLERVKSQGGRFAYYTSAATAMMILRNSTMWMRNTLVMNDFSEVEHGLECVTKAYKSAAGTKLQQFLNAQFEGITEEIAETFNAWIPGFRRDTYVLCLSEHVAEDDRYGRLSMWRAYGGNAGVAIVINGDVLFRESDALAAYSMPVAYLDEVGLQEEFNAVADSIGKNASFLQALGRTGTKDAIFHMLRYASICTKHPAFREEQEWRVVSSPALQSSSLVPVDVEVIGGIPQKVLKIKLEDHPDKGLTGLEPNQLIDRVLIGPCEHSAVIQQALLQTLNDAGIKDPGSKIFNTGIPLRDNQR